MTYYTSPLMTNDQKQIIIGTILGGSSIIKPRGGKNYFLSMRNKNLKWLKTKAQEIKELSSENPTYKESTYRWHSKCSPIFNEFYDQLYKNNKKFITIDILNTLRDIGLCVWFLDCGFIKNEQIIMKLRINKETISQYFSEIDLDHEIVKNLIIFNKGSTVRFLKTIGQWIPEFMKESIMK